jgi:hypothetical protein
MKFHLLTSLVFASQFASSAEPLEQYETEIKPLFKERCFACHGVLKQKGKLRLDTVEFMHQRDVIKNGELLYRLESDDEDEKMPPEGHSLSAKEMATVKNWLDAGAPAPKNEQAESDPKNHWSFQRIADLDKPHFIKANPIDHYLNKKFETKKLTPQGGRSKSITYLSDYILLLHFDRNCISTTQKLLKIVCIVPVLDDSHAE